MSVELGFAELLMFMATFVALTGLRSQCLGRN